MATTDRSADRTLRFARNGVNRPLHQDRQVLRAGDLTLEQATQDAMLARARRYLHGWGVVAGFVPEVADSARLTIGPGYGVTPLGDELFLPEPVSLPDAADAVVLCCGPGPLGCEVIDPEARAAAHAAAAGATVSAWLIARPASHEAAPRPGVPEGCAHPAATLLPSRRCGGVEFALRCDLPATHQPRRMDCDALMPLVCGSRGAAAAALPWVAQPGPEANFLVLARLSVTGHALTAALGNRRTLWPVALIQDWIASCLCPLLEQGTTPTVPGGGGTVTVVGGGTGTVVGGGGNTTTLVGGGVVVGPGPGGRDTLVAGPAGPTVPGPEVTIPGPDITDVITDNPAPGTVLVGPTGGPLVQPGGGAPSPRDRLTGSVTGIAGVGPARTRALEAIGVTTEGEFLAAPPERLATALRVPVTRVTEMKEALSARHNLGLVFR